MKSKNLIMIFFSCYLFSSEIRADVYLYSTTSTYKNESTNGQHFGFDVARPSLIRPDTAKTRDGTAFGSGITKDKVHYFTFSNTFVVGRQPTFAEAELKNTTLTPGTELLFTFYKDATDKINYILVSGDVSGPVKYASVPGYDTVINLSFTVGDPKLSASGDAGSAIGIVIDYNDYSPARDFHGAIFVTDAHPLDIGPTYGVPKGTTAVSIKGLSNSKLDLVGYLPESLLSKFGINVTDPADVLSKLVGYKFSSPASEIGISNSGIINSADFQYNVPFDSSSNIAKVQLSNSDWTDQGIGFGIKYTNVIETVAPTITLYSKSKLTTDKGSLKISLGAFDDSGIESVSYKVEGGTYQPLTLKNNIWSFKAKKLIKGKSVVYYIQAKDINGNLSEEKKVIIKRK